MSINTNNPFLLNLIPTFDVGNPSGSSATNDTGLTDLQTMINVSTYTVYANTIQPYTTDGTINMRGTVDITGGLNVNGYELGPNISGFNTITGSSVFISSFSANILLNSYKIYKRE
jgi:hypothetical protein